MYRLTTNKTVEEMSMLELAHNCCYAKDGYACYRDFDTDIDARELARDLMLNYGFWEIDSDEVLSDGIFDETMSDNLQYGSKEIEGLIALFYSNLWAMADLHSRLKEYEDAEEQGLLLRLPCKVGDVVYQITRDFISEFKIKTFVCDGKSFFFHWQCIKGIYVNVIGFHSSRIGKDVFLTKEEAEQALARMEKENG